jgi:hypothetical protein
MTQHQREIVVVVGMHRSGTSLCAHLLTCLGVDMADQLEVHPSNPKGHWERVEIRAYHDRILKLFDRDYYSPNHALALPTGWWTLPEVRKIRDELIVWLRQRMGTSARFGFKDPRTCRMMPLWREVLEELSLTPRFVYCVRDPAQVARSVAARDKLEAADTEYRWSLYHAHAIAGIGNREVAVLPYNDWFGNPLTNLARLVQHTSSWRADDPSLLQAVSEIIDPAFRHDSAEQAPATTPLANTFYRLLLESAPVSRLSERLRLLADDFVGIEQLNMPIQAKLLDLRLECAAKTKELADSAKNLADLKTEIQALQTKLEREAATASAAEVELTRIRAELDKLKQSRSAEHSKPETPTNPPPTTAVTTAGAS